VAHKLRAIQSTSQGVRKALRDALSQFENDPMSAKAMEFVPENIRQILEENSAALRSIKVIANPHDFRVLVIHFPLQARAVAIDAFPRKSGYEIDWDFVEEFFANHEDIDNSE
jgi:hypothetical protein